MTLSLTDAQSTDLGSKLFLLQPASGTKLPKPVTTPGAAGLSGKLDFLKTDDHFKNLGIGVIDFTGGPGAIAYHHVVAPGGLSLSRRILLEVAPGCGEVLGFPAGGANERSRDAAVVRLEPGFSGFLPSPT
jgi:hypothetical protein